jgi:hypothetical protein
VNQISNSPFGAQLSIAWHLFRHELLYVLWALMELAIITPLALALMPWARYWPPTQVVLWLLLVMLIPFNLSRIGSIFELPVQRQQVVMALGLIVIVLLSWRLLVYPDHDLLDFGWLEEMFGHITESGNPYRSREIALFALIVICWWRGISLVGRRVDVRDMGLRLRTGILLMALLVAGVAGTLLSWSVTSFILLYFFTALMAVVLTRVEQLELNRSGRSFPLGPKWMLVVVGAAGLLTFLTAVLTGFISGESVLEIAGWLAPIWLAITFLGAAVASMVSYLLVPVILLIEWLIGLIPFDFGAPAIQPVDFDLDSTVLTIQPEEISEQVPQLIETSQRLLPLLIMVFIVLLVSLALGRLFRIARRPADSEATSISPLDGIDRLGRPSLAQRLMDRLGFVRRWRSATSIRRIYQAMSNTAASHGYPRSDSETPYEYLETLAKAWPDHRDETELVTEAYIRVRYGEIPESKEEMDSIVVAWEKLQERDPEDTSENDDSIDLRRTT